MDAVSGLGLVDFYRGVRRMYGRVMAEPDGRTCPYCKERAQMTYIDDSARIVDPRSMRVEAAFQCYVCKRFVIGGLDHAGFTTDRDGHPFPLRLHESSEAEEIERVFEPFQRLRPRQTGAGLGLNLVKQVIDRHGGHVTILDAPEGGALIRIELPPHPGVTSKANTLAEG